MALVSVLIPVYNREAYLGEALRSALSQTVEDIEVIVVDNNSSDRSFEIANEASRQDSRVKVFRNFENVGPVENWLICASHASAPYSKLLFSDDLMAPQFLERMLPLIFDDCCSLVYCPAIVGVTPWTGSVQYRAFLTSVQFSRDYYLHACTNMDHFTPVSPGATVLRTADLRSCILTSLPGVESYDFRQNGAGVDWLILALTALRYSYVGYVPEPLVFFRSHPESITIGGGAHVVAGYSLARQWLKQNVRGL